MDLGRDTDYPTGQSLFLQNGLAHAISVDVDDGILNRQTRHVSA